MKEENGRKEEGGNVRRKRMEGKKERRKDSRKGRKDTRTWLLVWFRLQF